MPSWFMPIPSEIDMVVNSRGVPPAFSTPPFAASACGPCVWLQGVTSPFIDTIPIIGRAIAASSSPIARMNARCGVRSMPFRVTSDRSFTGGLLGGSLPCWSLSALPQAPVRRRRVQRCGERLGCR